MAMPRWIQVLIGFLFPAEPEPERTPVEVFDAAIRASRQRFLDLRAASSPLFAARDALVAQLAEQRAGDRERTQRELDDMQEPIRRVEANLRRLEAEVRDLEAERNRSASHPVRRKRYRRSWPRRARLWPYG
jgi:septal ring factor EnvC (AmiA/AmiB activator)